MKHPSKLSLIADPNTLLLGVFATTIGFGLCIGFAIYFIITGERQDIIGSLCVLVPIMGLLIVAVALALPRWYTRITLLPESVVIKTALRHPVERQYKYYQYVYKAWYWHGSPIGIGKNVEYIVISHRRLCDEELVSINQLSPDNDVLKIRYSPKTYRSLIEILPEEMQYKLGICGFQ